MTNEDPERQRVRIIARAWSDDGFRQKLLSNPAATLKAEGVDLPAGREVRIMEDTDKLLHLVLPARPGDLSDADLENVAGGRSAAGEGSAGLPPIKQFVAAGRTAPGSAQMGGIDDLLAQIRDTQGGRNGC